jgi:hypothetical protein
MRAEADRADVHRYIPCRNGRDHHRGIVCQDRERARAPAEHELDRDRVHAHADELPVSTIGYASIVGVLTRVQAAIWQGVVDLYA